MRFKYLLLFICCINGVFISCKEKNSSKPTVSVTILPQKFLIEQIAGDYLQVNVLIPPGMNPTTCDLNIAQLQKLYDSDLCFTIGHLPFEQVHLYPVLQQRPEIQVINHSKDLQLLQGSCGCSHHHEEHEHESIDPHIWLSPKVVRNMATQIFKTLSTKYPAQQQNFQQNYNQLIVAIDSLLLKAEKLFSTYPQRSFLIYHPALTYFAADYGLEQIAIEEEGKEPNPNHLKTVIDQARAQKVRLIFIQQQFDIQNAQAIAREIDGKIIPIDPLAENWLAEMQKLLEVFQAELSNTPEPL